MIGFEIIVKGDDFKKNVLGEIVKKLNTALRGAELGILRRTREEIEKMILDSAEYHDLVYGQLQGELGVVDPQSASKDIIEVLKGDIKSKIDFCKEINGQIDGGMTVYLYTSNILEKLFALPASSFMSEGGYKIDWLQWLLTRGTDIIIADHHFISAIKHPDILTRIRSRTGIGVMGRNGKWQISELFASKGDDNWITRAIHAALPNMENIFETELGKFL